MTRWVWSRWTPCKRRSRHLVLDAKACELQGERSAIYRSALRFLASCLGKFGSNLKRHTSLRPDHRSNQATGR
jgi:hypothetical protein